MIFGNAIYTLGLEDDCFCTTFQFVPLRYSSPVQTNLSNEDVYIYVCTEQSYSTSVSIARLFWMPRCVEVSDLPSPEVLETPTVGSASAYSRFQGFEPRVAYISNGLPGCCSLLDQSCSAMQRCMILCMRSQNFNLCFTDGSISG